MLDYDLTRAEQVRRTDLAQKARRMILSHMKVEAEDETSLTLDHRGYYMQISFSPLHPLLVVCLANLRCDCASSTMCENSQKKSTYIRIKQMP